MNTQNPVIHIVAHMSEDRRRVGFLPVAGGSLDALSVPVVQSVFTGKSIPDGQPTIIEVIDELRGSGYQDADFVLVAWGAQHILSETKRAIPALVALVGGKVVEMESLALAFAGLPSDSPYRFVRPDGGLALVDAVQDVYSLYKDNIMNLATSYDAMRTSENSRTEKEPDHETLRSPALLGVGGKKTAGKDTFASLLGDDWVVIGMSDPLYDVLLELNPKITYEVDGDATNTTYLSDYLHNVCGGDWTLAKRNSDVREMLQRLGTNVVRNMVDEDAWVDMMAVRVLQLHSEGKNVAVTGIRFPNELARIKDMGGSSVWVENSRIDSLDTHISELSLVSQDFDFIVYNNGSLDDLSHSAKQVADIVSS